MCDATIRTLAGLEYDGIVVASNLEDLAARLDACKDSARARVAAGQVRKLRGMLGHVLDGLDADVTAAIKAAERLSPAPW